MPPKFTPAPPDPTKRAMDADLRSLRNLRQRFAIHEAAQEAVRKAGGRSVADMGPIFDRKGNLIGLAKKSDIRTLAQPKGPGQVRKAAATPAPAETTNIRAVPVYDAQGHLVGLVQGDVFKPVDSTSDEPDDDQENQPRFAWEKAQPVKKRALRRPSAAVLLLMALGRSQVGISPGEMIRVTKAQQPATYDRLLEAGARFYGSLDARRRHNLDLLIGQTTPADQAELARELVRIQSRIRVRKAKDGPPVVRFQPILADRRR